MRPVLTLVLLLPLACTISEDAFPDAYAEAICDRMEECTEVFETAAEREDCERFWSGAAELLVDLGDLGGEYDPAGGADCVRAVRDATCAGFNDGAVECDVIVDDSETDG